MGGLIHEVYFDFYADVANWATKPLNPVELEASTILTKELAVKVGKHLFSLYITDDTGEFPIELVAKSTANHSLNTCPCFLWDCRKATWVYECNQE